MENKAWIDFAAKWSGEQKEQMEKNGFELPLTFHLGRRVYYFRREHFWAKIQAAFGLLLFCVGATYGIWWLWVKP